MKLNQKILLTTIGTTFAFLMGYGVILIEWNFHSRIKSEIRAVLSEELSIRKSLQLRNERESSPLQPSNIYLNYLLHGFELELFGQDGTAVRPGSPFGDIRRPELDISMDAPMDEGRKYILRKYKGGHYLTIGGRFTLAGAAYSAATKNITSIVREKHDDYIRFSLATFVSLLGLGAILFLSVKMNTKSLSLLTTALERLGKGDLDQHIPVQGPADIRFLSGQFNTMVTAVKENIDSMIEHSNRQELFIAAFTHELHTPLTNIIGFGEVISSRELEPSLLQKYAEEIVKEGNRLKNLGSEMRKIILLREPVCFEPVSSGFIERRIREITCGLLDAKNMMLITEIDECILSINRDLFISALINLTENSIKSSREKDHITLKIKAAKSSTEISIADNGCGIKDRDMQRVRLPFERGENQDGKSLGIGLYLVSRIMEIHNADFTIHSSPGKGTTARIVLKTIRDR